MALLASVGPMGLGAIDYALHCDRRPSLLVVTDIDDERLARAESIYTVEHAKSLGIELHYVNTSKPRLWMWWMGLCLWRYWNSISSVSRRARISRMAPM